MAIPKGLEYGRYGLEYGVLPSSGYGVSDVVSFVVFKSNHEMLPTRGAAPKQQQQVIPQTTAISNIKLPILKKEEYDIWAMNMEHYLEYIDNEVWKAIPKEAMRRFNGMDDAKRIWNHRLEGLEKGYDNSTLTSQFGKLMEHPLKNMVDRGIFDSGCSGHMTGNKDQLEDFEEFNGGSVTFGGSKCYISGKGKIRVGNLDFDSMYFVKELGNFNLFSISQICDKQHKVLFTETECLVVSPDFKMPDENQILFEDPRTAQYNFIRQIENQLSHKVKIIRSDNGTEFKNRDMLEFCGNKGIKQEYSNARTPQQNGVAERMNRTLIEAARTMLADSLLPTTFWAEAVSTACYIFNRVRVTKPQNKTPYELLFGHKPIISYIRPFGCHVTILDTLSVLGKFDGKSDEGFLVGTSEATNNAVESRTSSTNSKKKEILTDPQQEKKVSSTDTLEDNPKIQDFGRELEEIALKHLGTVPENNSTSTPFRNTGSQTVILRNLKRLLKLSKMTVGLKPCKKNCYSSSYNKFQMSSMGELIFFLGLQVKQNKAGIFISQDKYVAEILKKFDLVNVKAAITPMETKVALTKDEEAIDVMSTWVLETPRPLLPTMLLVATTNPNAGQEHHVVAQSQPSSSTLPVPFTSSPPVQSPPPIPTPTPIPETKPEPIGHTFEEPSPTHQHFSPPQEQAQGQMTMDDLLQVVPQLMSRIDSLETYLKQTKLTMGSVIVKLVKKVKKLEGILKRRNVVLSNSEEEELEAQGRKREEQVEDISPTTLEEAKTLSKVASQKPKSIDKGRRYKKGND
ncbi:putative ribonuclease H-like domain-containing protein [Tanacetum coccineum]|uniref:Ribonuclease H-like domain-containing protein n=1 Tax=Tanacetum coccineum TaxID=301880 RepID=A0ABQ5ENU1_9ASTR